MNIELLKSIIIDQQKQPINQTIIKREVYQEIAKWQNNSLIVVIMGVRRCGKSTLLQYLRSTSKEADYYINFDDDRLAEFQVKDFQHLLEAFLELFGKQNTFYFDEIQNIPEWERFVRRLHDMGNKIYITGSNAIMLSQELGTRLTGRYLPIKMYPFSFKEFIQFKEPDLPLINYSTEEKVKLKILFQHYSELGGFPEYVKLGLSEYLHTLYENVIYKDIIVRYRLTQERAIKMLVYYLASNIAKETSFNALKKLLNVANASTVADYCLYLQNSFLCFMINRYSPSLKQQVGYTKKVYFVDTALAKTVGFRISEDYGRLLENIVFLSLLRKHKEIYFHKEKYECDFIIKENHVIKEAIQVCKDLSNKATYEREIRGLLEAIELYSLEYGLILTEEHEEELVIEKNNHTFSVKIIPITKWLLV